MKVYMKVTNDKYELPVAIADTIGELAKITNTDDRTIRSAICHVKSGRRKSSMYKEIEIGDEKNG